MINASNRLCSKAVTLDLLRDLANGPDGTISLRARDLLRADSGGTGEIPPGRVTPDLLQVMSDCYRLDSSGRPAAREIRYKLADNSMTSHTYRNVVVWQHRSGDLALCGGDCPSSADPGYFDDRHSVLAPGVASAHAVQTFSGQLLFTREHVPVFVRGFGRDYRVLDIVRTGSVVYINGNAGGQVDPRTGLLVKSSYRICKN